MSRTIRKVELLVEAVAETAVWDAKKDAAILALQEDVVVKLRFNGEVEFVADPKKLIESCALNSIHKPKPAQQ